MNKRLFIPTYIQRGICKNHRPMAASVKVFGCDTETVDGEPWTLQISDGGEPELFYVDKKTILKTFLDYIDDHTVTSDWAVCYFHNLNFDMVSLFYGENHKLFLNSDFRLKRHGWDIYACCEKRFFAKLSKNRNKTIYIVDSYAFLPFSLSKAAESLKLPFKKLDKPNGLGTVKLKTKEFEDYAKSDVKIEYLIGKWIVDIHRQFDTRISVSLPQLASFIFRHHFLKPEDNIILPPDEVLRPALLSYHGGKNGWNGKPGVYKNCSEIDLNSAYAYAMSQLPSFLTGSYGAVNRYRPGFCGIYKVSGRVNCPYNIFFDENFKPVNGDFTDIWVTSYELEAAMKYNECRIDAITGFIWRTTSTRQPFKEYVDYFYKLKSETPKSNNLYLFYKLIMNALYGKLIQTVELRKQYAITDCDYEIKDDADEIKVKKLEKNYRAGGLFNPFIASMITGKVRAMLHDLEHKFKAIHSSTDSVKTCQPVTGCSNELGGYKLEVKGTCLIFRNKLYLHYDEGGELKKFALHGFQGNTKDLYDLYKHKGNRYSINHIFRIREALIQKKTPLKMDRVERTLKMDWSKFNDKAREK